jgi:hypothetical protein
MSKDGWLKDVYAFVIKVDIEGRDYYYRSYHHVNACRYCYDQAYYEACNMIGDRRGLDAGDVSLGEELALDYVRRNKLGCRTEACSHEWHDSDRSSDISIEELSDSEADEAPSAPAPLLKIDIKSGTKY